MLGGESAVGWEDLPMDLPERGPRPAPPPGRRRDVLSGYNFALMDKHVAQLSTSLLQGTLTDLVRALISPTKGDHVFAARAIFCWIASHPVTSYETPESELPVGCPMEWLMKLKNGQLDYAEMFCEMAKIAGIPHKIIHGFMKGAKYNISQPKLSENKSCWAAVYVKDSWRLVDCQWGSRHVITIADDDWTLVDGVGRCSKPNQSEQDLLHYQCSDYYFFSDPEEFIFSHFPTEDEDWQLLKKPVTLEEWVEMVYVKPPFFSSGLKLASHHKSTIEASESNLEVTLACPSNPGMRYRSKLFSENGSEKQPRCLDKYVLTRRRGKQLTCKVRIPVEDTYRLEIYVWNREENGYILALMYKISAVKGCYGDVTPLPGDGNQLTWGPDQDFSHLGIEALSHKEGIIKTSNDELEIRFKVSDPNDIKVFHNLTTFDKQPEQLSNRVIYYINKDKKELVFRVLLDESGEHDLTLGFDSICKQKQAVCKYLLQRDIEDHDDNTHLSGLRKYGYPPLPGGKLGDTEVAEKWGVTMSPNGPWIRRSDNSEMKFQAVVTKIPLQFACQMTLVTAEGGAVEVNDYVSCTDKQDGAEILVRFPHSGLYHLAVHARPSNASTPVDAYYNVYNYFIWIPNNSKRGHTPLPFPATFSTWKDNFKLANPSNGLLPTNSTVKFTVQVPGASGVSVVEGSGPDQKWTPLSRTSGDKWKADVRTEDEGSLQLCATFEEAREGHQRFYSSLLQYEVMEPADIKSYFQRRVDGTGAKGNKVGEGAIPKTPAKVAKKPRKLNSAASKERKRKAREIFEKELWQRLQEAVEAGSRAPLEAAVKSFRDHNVKDNNGVFEQACALLDFLRATDSLKESMASKHLDRLRLAIRHIENKNYTERLPKEMTKARKLLKSLERIDLLRRDVLSMDPTTWAEVRRYTSPLPTIHDVISGALLLLGDHEGKTRKWSSCQALLCNLGSEGLNRKINRFDVDELHPEIAARAKEVLYALKLEDVCDISLGVGTFFKWAVGMLEEYFSRYRHQDTAQPADVDRQKEIFNDFEPEIVPQVPAMPREDTLMATSPFAVTPQKNAESRSHMRRAESRSSWLPIFSRFSNRSSSVSPRKKNQK